MRFAIALAAGLLACLTNAQTPPDLFQIYPDTTGAATSATTRMSLGTSAGELLQEVPAKFFAGIGDNGQSCQVDGFFCLTQDQNQATAETFNIVIRSNLASGGPDASAAGLLFRSADVNLPSNPVGGVAAYLVNIAFATPVKVPCTGGMSYGLEVRAGAWTADAQSMHMAFYTVTPTGFPAGDNTRNGLLNATHQHAWYILNGVATRAALSGTSPGRSMRCGLTTKAAIVNIGNNDPTTTKTADKHSYGFGGVYPAIKDVANTRDDGLTARVLDTANVGGTAFLFLGTATGPAFNLAGFGGNLYLSLPGGVFSIGSAPILPTGTPVVGVASVPVAPPGAIPSATGVTLFFQAISVGTGFANPRFSNAQGVNF